MTLAVYHLIWMVTSFRIHSIVIVTVMALPMSRMSSLTTQQRVLTWMAMASAIMPIRTAMAMATAMQRKNWTVRIPMMPNDFPDHIPPVLTVDGPAQRITELDTVDLTGSVTDSGKGVATVVVVSDRYPGLSFAGVITAEQWQASVPLEVGSNQLAIQATDVVGNQSTLNISVEREEPNTEIGLTVTYPASASVVNEPTLVVRGQIRSNKPALQMNVLVNGIAATLTPTDQVILFDYQSEPVTLAEGSIPCMCRERLTAKACNAV